MTVSLQALDPRFIYLVGGCPKELADAMNSKPKYAVVQIFHMKVGRDQVDEYTAFMEHLHLSQTGIMDLKTEE